MKKRLRQFLHSLARIRREIHESATSNIRKARHKQKKDFDRCHLSNREIKVGDLIFGVITLKKRDNEMLKLKYNLSQLKSYVEEKTADTGGDTTEFTVAVDNEKL